MDRLCILFFVMYFDTPRFGACWLMGRETEELAGGRGPNRMVWCETWRLAAVVGVVVMLQKRALVPRIEGDDAVVDAGIKGLQRTYR